MKKFNTFADAPAESVLLTTEEIQYIISQQLERQRRKNLTERYTNGKITKQEYFIEIL